MTMNPDLTTASQTVSDFYKDHLAAYRAVPPSDEDDENCECVSMEPKAVVLRFLEAFGTTTDNRHPDGALCKHPFATALSQVSTAVINALETMEYPVACGTAPADPTAQSDGIREFTRQTFSPAYIKALLSSYTHCSQCAEHSTEQLFNQMKNGLNKSVDHPHGDDTVCNHPTHLANRRLVFTIYLGMDEAFQQAPKVA